MPILLYIYAHSDWTLKSEDKDFKMVLMESFDDEDEHYGAYIAQGQHVCLNEYSLPKTCFFQRVWSALPDRS